MGGLVRPAPVVPSTNSVDPKKNAPTPSPAPSSSAGGDDNTDVATDSSSAARSAAGAAAAASKKGARGWGTIKKQIPVLSARLELIEHDQNNPLAAGAFRDLRWATLAQIDTHIENRSEITVVGFGAPWSLPALTSLRHMLDFNVERRFPDARCFIVNEEQNRELCVKNEILVGSFALLVWSKRGTPIVFRIKGREPSNKLLLPSMGRDLLHKIVHTVLTAADAEPPGLETLDVPLSL